MQLFQPKHNRRILLLIFLLISLPCPLWAQKLTAGQVVFRYQNQQQLEQFNLKAYKAGLVTNLTKGDSPEATAGLQIYQIVERVQGILGLHPKDLHVNLALFDRVSEVQHVYRILYGKESDFVAFYSPRTETVYISLQELHAGIIIHELTHAVIHHYYTEATSVKVHELLAQYVENQF